MNETINPIIVKDTTPPKRRSSWKWNLPLNKLNKGEMLMLAMTEEKARDSARTIRTIVYRLQKKTPAKRFTVRLVVGQLASELEWTGIGVWRIR